MEGNAINNNIREMDIVNNEQEGCEEATNIIDNSDTDFGDCTRIICRYGRGCTHTDQAHKAAFWHPPPQILSDVEYHSHYICNECGANFPVLQDLQLHLKRKTAWSNMSLVGCRISCLVDNKEWHEGIVYSFSPNGKHLVVFHLIGERRWLNMKRVAFFIAERPVMRETSTTENDEQREHTLDTGEYKDDEIPTREYDGLAPVSDMKDWVYVEDISLDYAFAQSVLFKVFGYGVQETGHKTRGHTCLTDDDKFNAKFSKGSLLYGELLPRGANKAFSVSHLDCSTARVLFDLGMGTGKIAIQAFLQFRNLEYVYGVELSEGRYKVAEEAMMRLVNLLGSDNFQIQKKTGKFIMLIEKVLVGSEEKYRLLHLECGNLFDVPNMELADVVMLETDIPASTYPNLCQLLNQMHMGARTLSYLDLQTIWCYEPFNFRQAENNRLVSDRFPTSWSVQRGHHFFIWHKIARTPLVLSVKRHTETWGPADSPVSALSSRKRNGHEALTDTEREVRVTTGCFPMLSLFSGFFYSRHSRERSIHPQTEQPQSSNTSASRGSERGRKKGKNRNIDKEVSALQLVDTSNTYEMESMYESSRHSESISCDSTTAGQAIDLTPCNADDTPGTSTGRTMPTAADPNLTPRRQLNLKAENAVSITNRKTTETDRTSHPVVDANKAMMSDSSLQTWQQRAGHSPSAADSDSMNTPVHLRVNRSDNEENQSSRRNIVAQHFNWIASLPQEVEPFVPDSEGFVERQWDRSLYLPVSVNSFSGEPFNAENVIQRTCSLTVGYPDIKRSVDSEGTRSDNHSSRSDLHFSTIEEDADLALRGKQQFKKQRNAEEDTGCSIV